MLFLWNRGQTESIVAVIRQRVGRVIAVQIHDIAGDGTLRRAAAVHADGNRYDAGFRGSTPAHPCQLAVAVRVVDITDSVSPALNVKAYRYGVVRVGLSAAHLHGGDDFCVDAVFVVIFAGFGRCGHLVEADDADAKRGDDVAIGYLLRAAAGPCSVAEIRFLQKNRQRQILMGERPQLLSEIAVDDLIIQRRFRGGHGKLLTVVAEIGQRLHHDSVISTDKQIKVDSHISGNRSDDLFIGEIASDGSDAGFTAAGGDDLGQLLRWLHADIATHRGRQGSPSIIGELGHFSEMSNVCVGLLIAPIHHTSNNCSVVSMNDR